jgi:hypothetical protein
VNPSRCVCKLIHDPKWAMPTVGSELGTSAAVFGSPRASEGGSQGALETAHEALARGAIENDEVL